VTRIVARGHTPLKLGGGFEAWSMPKQVRACQEREC
jgi:hypothetical protein